MWTSINSQLVNPSKTNVQTAIGSSSSKSSTLKVIPDLRQCVQKKLLSRSSRQKFLRRKWNVPHIIRKPSMTNIQTISIVKWIKRNRLGLKNQQNNVWIQLSQLLQIYFEHHNKRIFFSLIQIELNLYKEKAWVPPSDPIRLSDPDTFFSDLTKKAWNPTTRIEKRGNQTWSRKCLCEKCIRNNSLRTFVLLLRNWNWSNHLIPIHSFHEQERRSTIWPALKNAGIKYETAIVCTKSACVIN